MPEPNRPRGRNEEQDVEAHGKIKAMDESLSSEGQSPEAKADDDDDTPDVEAHGKKM